MLVLTTLSDYKLKSYLAPLSGYGGVFGHIFTFDSLVPLSNAFIGNESPQISP